MWVYEKKLQFPVEIKKRDLNMFKQIKAQYGGPQGELGAALRYLNQRFHMPTDKGKALLTDIGTEELSHVEILSAMMYQLIDGASLEELKKAGLSEHYTEHGYSLFPESESGIAFTTAYISSTGDIIADLHENLAAEQKARAVYEHLINQTNDPDIIAPLSFLRQREVVHFQRFKELVEEYEKLNLH